MEIVNFFILLAKSTVVYPNELEEILNELDKINTKLEAYIADETQITFCELMKRFSNDSENKQFLETNSKCNLIIIDNRKLERRNGITSGALKYRNVYMSIPLATDVNSRELIFPISKLRENQITLMIIWLTFLFIIDQFLFLNLCISFYQLI